MISFKEFLIEITRNRYKSSDFEKSFDSATNKNFQQHMKRYPKYYTNLGEYTHKHTGNKIKVIDSDDMFGHKEIHLLNHKNELVGSLPYYTKNNTKEFTAAFVRKDHQGQGLLKDAHEHLSSQFKLKVSPHVSISAGAEKAIKRIGIEHDEIKNGLWFNIGKTLGAKDERDKLHEIKKIPPLDQKKVDKEIRRHGQASDYTTPSILRPRGYPEAQFKHGPHTIQMTHVPLERKFIFHHIPTGHPVAIARYEKNSEGVIDKIDQTKSSDYTQPALMLKAFQAIKSKHPVKLDPNKMVVTPQGQRAVEILKKRKQLEEGKLLDKPTKTLEQIAQKHNWSIDRMSRQLKRGIEVEKEHTSHSHVAREIALDHLWEKPDYYIKLSKMEG